MSEGKGKAAGGKKGRISLAGAIAIGVGGMVGAGVFSALGVAAESAGNALWLSFACGAAVVIFSTYSYAKLGVRYPSKGGAVEFLVRGFGDNILTGALNIYLWLAYIIAIALYASGFAAYFATFFTSEPTELFLRTAAVGVVLLFTLVNFLGARFVDRSETLIVAIKIAILLLFAGTGLFFIDGEKLAVSEWPATTSILVGTGILFIGYEGFGLITNAAGDMADPKKTLPRALYASVFLVALIYVSVAVVVSGSLTVAEIAASRDYALAQAAKPFLGMFGFKLVAVAAVLSTSSAINATLFGGANTSYMVAREGELPEVFERKSWKGCPDGLFITAGLVVAFILLFNLKSIAMMGSGAFLLVYAAVSAGHLRIAGSTGARRPLLVLAVALCLGMFALLARYMYQESKASFAAMFAILAAAFLIEAVYRKATGRRLRPLSTASADAPAQAASGSPSR